MKIAVVGDLLLDVDLQGTSGRTSPDAPGPSGPAPIVDVARSDVRAGGAGLVATLLRRDGHDVRLISVLGADRSASRLRGALDDLAPGIECVLGATSDPTPVKTRVRANGVTLARIDVGCAIAPTEPSITADMVDALGDVDALVVADYGRGMTAAGGLREAMSTATDAIPVVWDPHPRGAEPVRGVEVVTPNVGEAARFVASYAPGRAHPGGNDAQELTDSEAAGAARLLRDHWGSRAVAVTLGARGLVLCGHAGRAQATHAIRAPRVSVADSCGAGDRLASSAAAALGSGTSLGTALEHAVDVTAEFLRRGGVATLADAR